MDIATRILELQKRTNEHRELLLTEEAAKNALIMPFLQILGYDVFNPAEVIPEYTADVGIKKGEKVDYAIRQDDKIVMLVECKPSSLNLDINHASQLFRYFSVTDAKIAILTNGVIYKFFSDVDKPNKMDDKPFFVFSMDNFRQSDIRTIEKFSKNAFNIDNIVQEAGSLKIQSILKKEIEKELSEPSDEFIRMITSRVHDGKITATVKESFSKMISSTISAALRDMVNERLSSALNATTSPEAVNDDNEDNDCAIMTTEEEISGFRIIQAISSKHVDPKRVFIRDAKSYCAILLDDNNRKTIARLHFNGISAKYVGTFSDKNEERHLISDLTDIYKLSDKISERLQELEKLSESVSN